MEQFEQILIDRGYCFQEKDKFRPDTDGFYAKKLIDGGERTKNLVLFIYRWDWTNVRHGITFSAESQITINDFTVNIQFSIDRDNTIEEVEKLALALFEMRESFHV